MFTTNSFIVVQRQKNAISVVTFLLQKHVSMNRLAILRHSICRRGRIGQHVNKEILKENQLVEAHCYAYLCTFLAKKRVVTVAGVDVRQLDFFS